MKSIDEIKTSREKKSKKWGRSLVIFIKERYGDYYTYKEISQKLAKEHAFEISDILIKAHVCYYHLKNPAEKPQPIKEAGLREIYAKREEDKDPNDLEKHFERMLNENPVEKLMKDRENLFRNKKF